MLAIESFAYDIAWPAYTTKDCNLDFVVPIVIHGDDADSHRRRTFCSMTFSSALNVGPGVSPWDSKILVYCVCNQEALTETFDTLDSWIVWSCIELQEGQFMSVTPRGEPFFRGKTGPVAGPYRAVVFAIKGDEKFHQKCLKLAICLELVSTGLAQLCFEIPLPSFGTVWGLRYKHPTAKSAVAIAKQHVMGQCCLASMGQGHRIGKAWCQQQLSLLMAAAQGLG